MYCFSVLRSGRWSSAARSRPSWPSARTGRPSGSGARAPRIPPSRATDDMYIMSDGNERAPPRRCPWQECTCLLVHVFSRHVWFPAIIYGRVPKPG